MSYFKLSPRNLFTLNTRARGRHLTEPIKNTCNSPYYSLSIDENLECKICSCEAFLPIPVGKVLDFNSLEEVWNSPIAKILQADVDSQKFTWCAVDNCGIKTHSIKRAIYNIDINIDDSCNLQCASCRRDKIMVDSGPVYEYRLAGLTRIMTWLEKFEKPINIMLMGNGDPLASPVIRPLLKNYKPRYNQQFSLLTNGLLLKKNLSKSEILRKVSLFSISIDAGSKDVYEQVRFPGKWESLIENLDFLSSHLVERKARVELNFAVQKRNYSDLENFARLCEQYGFIGKVHELNDFGSWNSTAVTDPDTWTIANGNLLDHDVLNQAHLEFNLCKEMLHKVIKHKNIVTSPSLRRKIA